MTFTYPTDIEHTILIARKRRLICEVTITLIFFITGLLTISNSGLYGTIGCTLLCIALSLIIEYTLRGCENTTINLQTHRYHFEEPYFCQYDHTDKVVAKINLHHNYSTKTRYRRKHYGVITIKQGNQQLQVTSDINHFEDIVASVLNTNFSALGMESSD